TSARILFTSMNGLSSIRSPSSTRCRSRGPMSWVAPNSCKNCGSRSRSSHEDARMRNRLHAIHNATGAAMALIMALAATGCAGRYGEVHAPPVSVVFTAEHGTLHYYLISPEENRAFDG